MIRTHCISKDCTGIIDETEDSLSCTIYKALTYWNEETGPQSYIMTDEDDNPLVTLMRSCTDYHVAYVLYSDGRKETYRVTNEIVTKL